MVDRYKTLKLLSRVLSVFAWLAVLWGLYALVTVQIEDDTRWNEALHTTYVHSKGIGWLAALAIAADAAVRFVAFMGASQAIKLWLELDASVSALAHRLGDVTMALTEVNVALRKTSQHVQLIGNKVYEEEK